MPATELQGKLKKALGEYDISWDQLSRTVQTEVINNPTDYPEAYELYTGSQRIGALSSVTDKDQTMAMDAIRSKNAARPESEMVFDVEGKRVSQNPQDYRKPQPRRTQRQQDMILARDELKSQGYNASAFTDDQVEALVASNELDVFPRYDLDPNVDVVDATGLPVDTSRTLQDPQKVQDGVRDTPLAERFVDGTVHYDRDKPFYQTSAFASAMMSYTMANIMGYDQDQALMAGITAYSIGSERDKRQHYRDELLSQGYDERRIEQWVNTGVESDLGDPASTQIEQITAPSKQAPYGLYQVNGQIVTGDQLGIVGPQQAQGAVLDQGGLVVPQVARTIGGSDRTKDQVDKINNSISSLKFINQMEGARKEGAWIGIPGYASQFGDATQRYDQAQHNLIGPFTKALYGGNASESDRQSVENMFPGTFTGTEAEDQFFTNLYLASYDNMYAGGYEGLEDPQVRRMVAAGQAGMRSSPTGGVELFDRSNGQTIGIIRANVGGR